MKQSIRPIRATLYLQFMKLRDLNPAKSCQSRSHASRNVQKWKRHGEADVNVSALTAHCNSKKINGFRWKGSCFMVSYFCSNSNCQKTQLRVHVYKNKKKWQCWSLRDILVACREIGSLPEQVIKQKGNL